MTELDGDWDRGMERRRHGRRKNDGEVIDSFARQAIRDHERECGQRWAEVRDLMREVGRRLVYAAGAVVVALLGVIGYLLTHPEITIMRAPG
ncbi:MAG: hypothetical protein ACREER_09905 [Alphaproteobacteria bacterium]